jgi:hypothetical protein
VEPFLALGSKSRLASPPFPRGNLVEVLPGRLPVPGEGPGPPCVRREPRGAGPVGTPGGAGFLVPRRVPDNAGPYRSSAGPFCPDGERSLRAPPLGPDSPPWAPRAGVGSSPQRKRQPRGAQRADPALAASLCPPRPPAGLAPGASLPVPHSVEARPTSGASVHLLRPQCTHAEGWVRLQRCSFRRRHPTPRCSRTAS